MYIYIYLILYIIHSTPNQKGKCKSFILISSVIDPHHASLPKNDAINLYE